MHLSIVAAAAAVVAFTVGGHARPDPVVPAGASQIQTHHDFSAAKRSKKRVRGQQAYGSGQQIACTYLGCNPIPRGCRIQPGRIPFTWDPSGFDEVQYPLLRIAARAVGVPNHSPRTPQWRAARKDEPPPVALPDRIRHNEG